MQSEPFGHIFQTLKNEPFRCDQSDANLTNHNAALSSPINQSQVQVVLTHDIYNIEDGL